MITEDYVSFETAKLLKEKEFDEPCIATYNLVTKDFEVEEVYQDWTTRWAAYVSAPTLQMAMKWLREKHIIIIPEVETFYADGSVSSWEYHIWCDDNYEEEQHGFSSYEEACEAAIKYCLENLI